MPRGLAPLRLPLLLAITISVVSARPAAAQAPRDLRLMPLEDLMQIDVTAASRRPEPVGTTGAAVSVITSDEIRRSGLTTIGDILQLADGLHVARANNGSWSVGARGFNGATPNKLLVMIDGRTMNSSIYTGVFWNVLDYVLEDIERIEVLRGPGAALWGANAVNGVVNIITKHTRDTQGTYGLASTGPQDPALGTVRYGGKAGASTWRAYGKFAMTDDQRLASGAEAGDARQRGQAGFRMDGGAAQTGTWMLKGDAFHSSDSFLNRPDGEYTELGLQAKWSKPTTATSRLDLQSFYRREYRRVPESLTHHVNVFDLDAQHSSIWRTRHALIFGGDFRVSADGTEGTPALSFDPANRTYVLTSVFAQDDIAVKADRTYVTLGAKYEHNAFSGGALQPSIRARMLLPRNQTVWGALSHAIRRPTRIEVDTIAHSPSGAVSFLGNEDFEPESLIATELGYRAQPLAQLSAEITLFRHDYDKLRSQEAPLLPTGPLVFGNTLEGQSKGVEMGVTVQPAAWWRAHVSYTLMDIDIERKPGSRDVSGGASEANDPDHLFGAKVSFDLPRNLELDAMLRNVGELQPRRVPGYTELNVRLGWHPTRRTELWIAGQDLLHSQHPELGVVSPTRVEFERAIRIGAQFRLP